MAEATIDLMVEREISNKIFKGGHEIGKNVAEFMKEETRFLKLSEKESYEVLWAVDEMVANIIDHAYEGKKGEVGIHLKQENGDLVIEIRAKGKPFDPASVKEYKNISQDRGRGLFITKSIMNEVLFKVTPEGNLLTLTKRLDKK